MEMPRSVRQAPAGRLNPSQDTRRGTFARSLVAALMIASGVVAGPAMVHAAETSQAAAAHPSRAVWLDVSAEASGKERAVTAKRFRAITLDRLSIKGLTANAPMERTQAARLNPIILSLPDPAGGFQRFSIAESPVMEPGLAAKHPEIKTYAGRGIDDKTASIRMDISPLGLHASIRSKNGAWYIDPYFRGDDSVYASYFTRDATNPHGVMVESALGEPQISLGRSVYHAGDKVEVRAAGFAAGQLVTIAVQNAKLDTAPRQVVHAVASAEGVVSATLTADPYRNVGSYSLTATDGTATATAVYRVVRDGATTDLVSGAQLKTYRLALITDPSYATYFGGSANVTAAKVTLINRVTQVYEDETSIRLVLVNGNDALNLDTAALATGANGPCGGSACFTAATLASCGAGQGLARNRIVAGLLVGAGNYDIGHLALGVNGGGVANLGVVGASAKAQGCTGIPTPVGDFFAVDYVAHEMGHQFAGNHTFNGTQSNCSTGNRSASTSVEPGSGSSIMAYAGICGTDNLQSHSDAYWSQRSFDEITTYTSSAETNLNEVQMGVLTNFAGTQQFQLRYNGADSAAIVRGSNFTTAGVKAAIEAIAGWPAGGTVTVSTLGDTAFTITFGGALAGTNVPSLQLVNCTAGCTGYIGEITAGGITAKQGTGSATGNTPPVVTTTPSYTIPVRTPFALTGSASDADGDTVTYMWEQNDRGATGTTAGTGLITQPKLNGPLFRQFGTQAIVSSTDTLQYHSPGENVVGTDPTRVFPDLLQILAGNTNAETGSCPVPASTTLTTTEIACFSEFLPTAAYVGTASVNAGPPASLNFRLTARDGRGGVANSTTQLLLAPAAGPFLVTSPNTAVSYTSGTTQTVTWSVANTDVAPVSTANVKISLSTDSGLTYPTVLAASVPNTGSAAVALPAITTTTARVKIEAVGNVFFDISNADFTIKAAAAGDVNGDGVIDCVDLAIVKGSIGKTPGQPGYDARADVNGDGVVNIKDLSFVSAKLPAGTTCR